MKVFLCIISVFYISSLSFAQIKNPRGISYTWQTDTTQRTVELDEISVVVPRNTFPKIDYPEFIGKAAGLDKFFHHEPVIAVTVNGKSKAYPLNMLTMHEISNDSLGGVPILPTFCPLCNSSVVYDRRLKHNGKDYLLTFEVSGMLRNSDMVMADQETQTWWQQLMGWGIVGELAGAELTIIPSVVISVKEFFESYPEGLILSPDLPTRAKNNYGTNPYVGYDKEGNTPYADFFDFEKLDARLDPMERILDLESPNGHKVYPFSAIAKSGVINDHFDGMDIVIFHKKGTVSVLDARQITNSKAVGSATLFSSKVDGKIHQFYKKGAKFFDRQTESEWNISGKCIAGKLKGKQLKTLGSSNHFAFAWLSFFPDSEIYSK